MTPEEAKAHVLDAIHHVVREGVTVEFFDGEMKLFPIDRRWHEDGVPVAEVTEMSSEMTPEEMRTW